MASDPEAQMKEETQKSLERMQTFDVDSLPRENELGNRFSFREVVPPARRLIELYERLALSALDDLPLQQLQQIRDYANQDYSRLEQIVAFDPTQQNAIGVHQQYIEQIRSAYQGAFNILHPSIHFILPSKDG